MLQRNQNKLIKVKTIIRLEIVPSNQFTALVCIRFHFGNLIFWFIKCQKNHQKKVIS